MPLAGVSEEDLYSLTSRSLAFTVSQNSFTTTPRDSTEHDHGRWSDGGCPSTRHTWTISSRTNLHSTPSSVTLHDEDMSSDEKEKRQMSDSSSTIALPVQATVKSTSSKRAEAGLNIPSPLELRHSYPGSLPMFGPHPAVRPRENSIWAMKSSEDIPLGTEIHELTPPGTPGTPLLPTESSGLGKWHEWLFVFNVCLAQIFSLSGLAQSFAPLLIIADSLGVSDPGQMSWYVHADDLLGPR